MCSLAFSLLCMQVIDAQVCHQSAAGHTLFFMPHCERQAFEDILAANWASERLPKVAILGETLWQRALAKALCFRHLLVLLQALSCYSQRLPCAGNSFRQYVEQQNLYKQLPANALKPKMLQAHSSELVWELPLPSSEFLSDQSLHLFRGWKCAHL